ncbi:MAG: archaeosortase/exosortase family protein, partial [Alphaproteobacteria bacterium]|nr:archaeosortase/exosortase family protein [Alphaproteobacteria bacterium]
MSVLVCAGAAVGLRLAWDAQDRSLDAVDVLAISLGGLLILLPHHAGSWMAVALLGAYLMLRNGRCHSTILAGMLFALVSVSAYWCRIVAQLFADPVLSWDAALAAGLLGLAGEAANHVGNIIVAGNQGPILVTPGCSSLRIVSYAVLCWATVAFALRPAWSLTTLAIMTGIATLFVLSNVVRLAIIAVNEGAYAWIHSPIGESVYNIVVLISAAAP